MKNLLLLLLVAVACTGPGQMSPPTVQLPTPTLVPPTATAAPRPIPTLGIGSTAVSPVDGMAMVYVPAGPFQMGLEPPEGYAPSHATDIRPPQTVTLDAFWIDQTEVTNLMYAFCVNEGVCDPPKRPAVTSRSEYFGNPLYANYPVLGVTWENANVYCEWAGRRLPTEAEWEKAARGTDGRLYPWGNQPPSCERVNYLPCGQETLPIGSLPAGASPYGALDMAGNVYEWVADWYEAGAYPTPFPVPGKEPTSETLHVVRGGSWANNDAGGLLSPMRFFGWPIDEISVGFGFRCARDAEP